MLLVLCTVAADHLFHVLKYMSILSLWRNLSIYMLGIFSLFNFFEASDFLTLDFTKTPRYAFDASHSGWRGRDLRQG